MSFSGDTFTTRGHVYLEPMNDGEWIIVVEDNDGSWHRMKLNAVENRIDMEYTSMLADRDDGPEMKMQGKQIVEQSKE